MELNKVHEGSALNILKTLPDGSIDCCITSPPYWSLRDYDNDLVEWDGNEECEHEWLENNSCKKCGAWKGQLGLEPDLNDYITHLCDVFEEVKRVLKNAGTCWVNIADTYANNTSGGYASYSDKTTLGIPKDGTRPRLITKENYVFKVKRPPKKTTIPEKSLCLIPFLFSIEMQRRGWIVRNVVIWQKPNAMPSSASDRFTVDFEYIFLFVKNKKYFFEQQIQPFAESTLLRARYGYNSQKAVHEQFAGMSVEGTRKTHEKINSGELIGRNMRSVWNIPLKGVKNKHYASYPEELIETPIQAGCPESICSKCGTPKRKKLDSSERVNTRPGEKIDETKKGKTEADPNNVLHNSEFYKFRQQIVYKDAGYETCDCNAEFQPGIVLDPFFGSGTTGVVAKKLDRSYIGIELNPEFVKISEDRLREIRKVSKTFFDGAE